MDLHRALCEFHNLDWQSRPQKLIPLHLEHRWVPGLEQFGLWQGGGGPLLAMFASIANGRALRPNSSR